MGRVMPRELAVRVASSLSLPLCLSLCLSLSLLRFLSQFIKPRRNLLITKSRSRRRRRRRECERPRLLKVHARSTRYRSARIAFIASSRRKRARARDAKAIAARSQVGDYARDDGRSFFRGNYSARVYDTVVKTSRRPASVPSSPLLPFPLPGLGSGLLRSDIFKWNLREATLGNG